MVLGSFFGIFGIKKGEKVGLGFLYEKSANVFVNL